MNATTERTPTVTSTFGNSFVTTLIKGFEVIKTLEHLIKEGCSKEQWMQFIETVPWDDLTHATLRDVALMAYNHEHGHVVLYYIIPLNVLHFEDFGRMSVDWRNNNFWLTWQVMHKAQEVARYCNKVPDGRIISSAIANSNHGGKESWCALRYAYD